jgi:peptide/nickel transport system substrate-binding protein
MATPRIKQKFLFTLSAALLGVALQFTAFAGAQAAPVPGGQLKVGWNYSGGTFDPHKGIVHGPDYWVIKLVYDTLVELDADLNVVPELASSWEISDDGLTYTFHLVQGAKFHNGRELTSADVRYSFERLLDPETGASRRANYTDIEAVTTPDDYTVVLTLSRPNAVMLTQLTQAAASIVAHEGVDEFGDLSQHEAGSGPFILRGVQPDNSILIEKNPDYFVAGLPYLDSILFTTVADNQARNTAVRTGDLDLITHVTDNYISLLRQDPNVVIPEGDGASGQWFSFIMNVRQPPFDDLKVRQAISYALDRELLARVSLDGEGFPLLGGSLAEWHWAALAPVFSGSNMERAKELMAESNHAGGFEFALRVWSPQQFAVRAAQIIQATLAELNIKVTIDQQGDWATYWGAVTGGTYDATLQGFGGNIDPHDYLFEAFREGGGRNVMGYVNPAVDQLLADGLRVTDRDERKAIYDALQTIVVENAPQVFIWNQKQSEAHQTYVKGFYHHMTLDLSALITTWLEK